MRLLGRSRTTPSSASRIKGSIAEDHEEWRTPAPSGRRSAPPRAPRRKSVGPGRRVLALMVASTAKTIARRSSTQEMQGSAPAPGSAPGRGRWRARRRPRRRWRAGLHQAAAEVSGDPARARSGRRRGAAPPRGSRDQTVISSCATSARVSAQGGVGGVSAGEVGPRAPGGAPAEAPSSRRRRRPRPRAAGRASSGCRGRRSLGVVLGHRLAALQSRLPAAPSRYASERVEVVAEQCRQFDKPLLDVVRPRPAGRREHAAGPVAS